MTGAELRDVFAQDSALAVGTPVVIRWTNCGHYYEARAVVSKLNAKSLKARLLHAVPTGYSEPYPVGREIHVPRVSDMVRWTANNCAVLDTGARP